MDRFVDSSVSCCYRPQLLALAIVFMLCCNNGKKILNSEIPLMNKGKGKL